MSNTSVSAAIARHIEELEVALRHATNVMDRTLGKEAGRIIQRKIKEFGWAGKVDDDLEAASWFAPNAWRTADGVNDAFDLYMNFEGSDCIDGHSPETWVGQFLEFAGAGMQLSFGTDALGRAKWKAVLREQAGLIEELRDLGFICDAREGDLLLNVQFDKAAVISGFEDGDLSEALLPIETQLDRVRAAKSHFDRLVKAIRAKA